MSTELVTPKTPKDESLRKHKDRSEKRSSKKRRRDERGEPEAQASQKSPASPTKKRRIATSSEDNAAQRDTSNGDDSPIYIQTSSLYLPLSPICQRYPIEGICAEHLSPLILSYHPPLKGVVLSYDNVRLSEKPVVPEATPHPVLAKAIDEYAVNFVWVTADFVLLKPKRSLWIDGWVNLQNESHLGLVCWNLFSASIERKRLPKDWKWVEDSATTNGVKDGGEDATEEHVQGEGHYVDGSGAKVEGLVRFRIRDIETLPSTENERRFISIDGTLLGDEEEKDLVEQDSLRLNSKAKGSARRPRPQPQTFSSEAIVADASEGTGTSRSLKSQTKHSTS